MVHYPLSWWCTAVLAKVFERGGGVSAHLLIWLKDMVLIHRFLIGWVQLLMLDEEAQVIPLHSHKGKLRGRTSDEQELGKS